MLAGTWGRHDHHAGPGAGTPASRGAHQGFRPEPAPIFHTVETLRTHRWILLDIAHHGRVLFDPEGALGRELDAVRRRLRELGSRRVERPDGSWYWQLKPDWQPGETVEL